MPAMRTVSSRYLHTQCYGDKDIFARNINFFAVAPSLRQKPKKSFELTLSNHAPSSSDPFVNSMLKLVKMCSTASKDGKNILREFEVELYFHLT